MPLGVAIFLFILRGSLKPHEVSFARSTKRALARMNAKRS